MVTIPKEKYDLFHRWLYDSYTNETHSVSSEYLKILMGRYLQINVDRKETFDYNLKKLIREGRLRTMPNGKYLVTSPNDIIDPVIEMNTLIKISQKEKEKQKSSVCVSVCDGENQTGNAGNSADSEKQENGSTKEEEKVDGDKYELTEEEKMILEND